MELPGGLQDASDTLEAVGRPLGFLDRLCTFATGIGAGVAGPEDDRGALVGGSQDLAGERVDCNLDGLAGEVAAADLVQRPIDGEGGVLPHLGGPGDLERPRQLFC